MIEKEFGLWTVIGEPVLTSRGERKWFCRCACGTERYVLERALKSGSSQSCGCLRKEKLYEARAHDLLGKTFGELTVLSKSQSRHNSGGVWWICRCTCGEIYECQGTHLVMGRRTHCAGNAHKRSRNFVDIQGQRFGILTVLYPTAMRDAKGSVVWHCRCDCGKETDVPYNNLMYTNLVSCGCRREEHTANLGNHLTRVAGTSMDILKSKKVPKNNTTGHKGVYLVCGKYLAKIHFQKKQYYLGTYDHIEDAIQARLDAEEQLFDRTADFYARWKKKAEADPMWAKENPIRIEVRQRDKYAFSVSLSPAIKENEK